MTLVCILPYESNDEWGVASAVHRYLSSTYGPIPSGEAFRAPRELGGVVAAYRSVIFQASIDEPSDACEEHRKNLLAYANTLYAKFGFTLHEAAVYCYPL